MTPAQLLFCAYISVWAVDYWLHAKSNDYHFTPIRNTVLVLEVLAGISTVFLSILVAFVVVISALEGG